MKKKILVVSDNSVLTEYFQSEVALQKVSEDAKFDYRYSKVNQDPRSMINLGAKEIDVKDFKQHRELLKSYDLIISLHCKSIFPSELVEKIRCVNYHPGFNPHNRGWYPQVFSILNKKPIGATLHVMDRDIDHGDIIDQIEVAVEMSDTSLELYERVLKAEKKLIKRSLRQLVSGRYELKPMNGEGNLNLISDFRELCALDLESEGTLGEHLDLLRALSHGSFRNAYFKDQLGRKVFVRISLECEQE